MVIPNVDPDRQQGGDMVRVGSFNYVCDLTQAIHKRISNLTLDDGTPLELNQQYKVTDWATMAPVSGKPIWEVVADYLRTQQTVKLDKINSPKLLPVANNLGIS